MVGGASSAVKSWRKVRSPIIAKVRSNSFDRPKIVERFPSIPANPRLAKVLMPLRGLAKASRSRIGLDEPVKSAEPSGSCEAMVDIAKCSYHSPSFAISAAAILEVSFQSEIQVGLSELISNLGSSKNICVAVLFVSIVEILGSTT